MGGRSSYNHARISCFANTFLEFASRAKMVLSEHGSSVLPIVSQ